MGNITETSYFEKLQEELENQGMDNNMSKTLPNIGTITIDLSDEDCWEITEGNTLGTWCFPIFDKDNKRIAEVNVNVVPESLKTLGEEE